MGNDPQDNVDVPADEELADEMLGQVNGGADGNYVVDENGNYIFG